MRLKPSLFPVLLLAAGLAAPAIVQEAAEAATAPDPKPAQEPASPELLSAPAETQQLVMGTAPVAGRYFPTGGALCRVVNAGRAQHGLRCFVEATSGAAENLTRLEAGDLDLALVQSDWQYHAYRSGVGLEDERPFEGLRSVMSLQALPFTLLAAPDSGIEILADLEGKRVNLGPAESPSRASADFLVEALGWDHDDFAEVGELEGEQQAIGLCDGRIDAALLPASHPSNIVAWAAEACGAQLIEIDGEAVGRLLNEWAFYAPAVIPGGLYANNPDPVRSFGLRATLVTSEATPPEAVYRFTKTVFEAIDTLRAQHAVLAGLSPQEMASAGNSAPLHEGALRYYRERGWR